MATARAEISGANHAIPSTAVLTGDVDFPFFALSDRVVLESNSFSGLVGNLHELVVPGGSG